MCPSAGLTAVSTNAARGVSSPDSLASLSNSSLFMSTAGALHPLLTSVLTHARATPAAAPEWSVQDSCTWSDGLEHCSRRCQLHGPVLPLRLVPKSLTEHCTCAGRVAGACAAGGGSPQGIAAGSDSSGSLRDAEDLTMPSEACASPPHGPRRPTCAGQQDAPRTGVPYSASHGMQSSQALPRYSSGSSSEGSICWHDPEVANNMVEGTMAGSEAASREA